VVYVRGVRDQGGAEFVEVLGARGAAGAGEAKAGRQRRRRVGGTS
jgi:hypothetical protein